jgi:hypothetical protein
VNVVQDSVLEVPATGAQGGATCLLERTTPVRQLIELEPLFKSRRGLFLLMLVTLVSVGLVRCAMYWGGMPGWDDAAHVYKVFLLRDGYGVTWDNFWYGGSYGAITYGVLYYWLAQYIPGPVVVTVASGFLPVLFYLYYSRAWRIDDIWPAWMFALILGLYQANGQDPFLVALCLSMGGLALLAARRPFLGALLTGIGLFCNPLALFVVGVLLLGDLVGRPALRRRILVFGLCGLPFLAVKAFIALAFPEPSSYLNELSTIMLFLAFALAGVALSGVNAVHWRRPLVALFGLYALICLASYALHTSLGNNVGRFYFILGLPLLFLLRNDRLKRPLGVFPLAIIPITLFALISMSSVFNHYTNHMDLRQTEASYFTPALAAAQRYYDPDHRIHVVALRRHWEAYYFPKAGYPITRGWYRQADAIHGQFFYEGYDADDYEGWLRSMGVRYVFLPSEPLDRWSWHEKGLLKSSPAFTVEARVPGWTIYRFRDDDPLLVPLDGGAARVTEQTHLAVRLLAERPGRYLLKVTWSPYWEASGGARLAEGSDRWTVVTLPAAGTYELRMHVTLARCLDQVGL